MEDFDGKLVVKEEVVMKKFDGEVEDGILREQITIVDGVVIKHEYFDEDGNPVDGEGGDYDISN